MNWHFRRSGTPPKARDRKASLEYFWFLHPDDARGVVSIETHWRKCRSDPVAATPPLTAVRRRPVWAGTVRRRREAHRRRETTARFVAGLVPRRRELLELSIHRPPRRLHPIDSGSKPSERCDQPPPHARRPFDRPIHIHFRIRNVNRPLYFHEAPFRGHRPGDPPLLPPPLECLKNASVMP